MNFTSNFVSLGFFLANGLVSLPEVVVMGLRQFAGSRVGARLVLRRGSGFIRPVFIAVVVAISAKLFVERSRKLRQMFSGSDPRDADECRLMASGHGKGCRSPHRLLKRPELRSLRGAKATG